MKTTLKTSLKKIAASAVLIFSCSGFIYADTVKKDNNKLSAIREQVKNQLRIPASLKNKGLNEKACVSFVIEGENITGYKIETPNQVLKENLSAQFEKMKIKLPQENAAGSYKIELNFKVL